MTIIGGLQFEGKTYLAWDSCVGGVDKTTRSRYSKFGEFSNGVKFITCGYYGVGKIFEQQFVMPGQEKDQDDYSYMLDVAYAYKKFAQEQDTNVKDEHYGLNEFVLYYNNKLYTLDSTYCIHQIDDVLYLGSGESQSNVVDYLFNSGQALKVDNLNSLDIFKLAIASACDINSECDRPYFIYNVTDNLLEEYK